MEVSPELILGIFGSIMGLLGATSFFIHVLRYLKEKPKIEAEVIDVNHYYTARGENETNYWLSFSINVRVRNKGDRGTTIGDSAFYFAIGKQQFPMIQERVFLSNGSRGRIEPNDLVKFYLNPSHPSSYDKLPKQEKIPFKLVMHHAHGVIELKGVSKISKS